MINIMNMEIQRPSQAPVLPKKLLQGGSPSKGEPMVYRMPDTQVKSWHQRETEQFLNAGGDPKDL